MLLLLVPLVALADVDKDTIELNDPNLQKAPKVVLKELRTLKNPKSINNPQELKFYINAGHGGWGRDDRPMPTRPFPSRQIAITDYTNNPSGTSTTTYLPDTCGFFESNTNLWKCEALKETLIKMGANPNNIRMSRDENGPFPQTTYSRYDDDYSKWPSTIAGEAEEFAPDLFISIHSDAGALSYGASSVYLDNHVLFLYRGHDGVEGDLSAGSRDIAYALWEKHFMDEIDYMSPGVSRTSTNIRGDFDFYGSGIDITNNIYSGIPYEGYLGALKHGYPGLLIEGFSHQYEPETHRALNRDFCRQEGVRLARGICDYFNMTPETTGYIMGTVKDKGSTPPFTYYNTGEDSYLPINGAMVKLYKGNNLVNIYPTDEFYNGIFVFENLEPGDDYYINVVAEGYAPLTHQGPFTVVANETTYPKLYMNQSTTTTIHVSDLEYELTQEFTDLSISVLENKTVRRAILHEGMLYVLAVDNDNTPYIYQIDPDTQQATAISTTGVTNVANENNQGNHLYTISDIAITNDSKLLACNQLQCQNSASEVASGKTRGIFRVYKWDSMSGNPTLWFTSQTAGYWYNADVGNTMAFFGNSSSGKLITTATTIGSSRGIRTISFTILDNNVIETVINKSNDVATAVSFGEDYQFTPSNRHRDFVVLNGSLHKALEFQVNTLDSDMKSYSFDGNVQNATATSVFPLGTLENQDIASIGGNFFKHDLFNIYVTPFSRDGANNNGIALYAANAGLGSAEIIETTDNTLTGKVSTYTMADGYSDGNEVIIYLLRDNLLTKWNATGTVVIPDDSTPKGIFAYGLNSTANSDGSYTFQFTSNANSREASLVFYDSSTQQEVGRVKIENVSEGIENTITLAQCEIPGDINQTLNWGVYLKGKNINAVNKLNPDDAIYNYSRLGVAVDNSPESDYFGRFYLIDRTGKNTATNGLWAFNADYSRINSTILRGGETYTNPYRVATDPNGKIYIADWGDGHSGVFVASPDNLNGTFPQFFQGTRQSDGLITNNGQNVGSSNIAVAIGSTGSNTKMYTYLEDFEANNVAVYNIGQPDGTIATSWGKAPSNILQVSSIMLNGNSDIRPDKYGGVWVSQRRTKGNNAHAYPSLIHVDPDGNINYNSGDNLTILNGSPQAGFAVNRENTILAIGDGDGVIQVYDITWNGNTPTLTPRTSFPSTVSNASGEIQQMDFDWGGNLYVAGTKLGIYSIPIKDNSSIVPAKLALTITKESVEKTLAELVNDNDVVLRNAYTIADNFLTCVYVAKDNRTIYCKDDNGYVDKSILNVGQRDFIAEHFSEQSTHDQSNWIAITLPRELTTGDGNWCGRQITDITGMVTNLENPAMTITTMPTTLNEMNYIPNTYITCNFVSENWNNSSYFFVKPKPCEYAFITWALWDETSNAFVVPNDGNTANLTGGFRVDLSLMDYQGLTGDDPADLYEDGEAYQFNAIIMRNNKAATKASGNSSSIGEEFTIYPLDYSNENIITNIKQPVSDAVSVVKTEYYGINGMLLNGKPEQGICIERQYLSNGKVVSKKIIIK